MRIHEYSGYRIGGISGCNILDDDGNETGFGLGGVSGRIVIELKTGRDTGYLMGGRSGRDFIDRQGRETGFWARASDGRICGPFKKLPWMDES